MHGKGDTQYVFSDVQKPVNKARNHLKSPINKYEFTENCKVNNRCWLIIHGLRYIIFFENLFAEISTIVANAMFWTRHHNFHVLQFTETTFGLLNFSINSASSKMELSSAQHEGKERAVRSKFMYLRYENTKFLRHTYLCTKASQAISLDRFFICWMQKIYWIKV